MFGGARCIEEMTVNGDDCFILRPCADPETRRARSEGLAEIIRHVLFGYFNQKTGLLVHLEDSHLENAEGAYCQEYRDHLELGMHDHAGLDEDILTSNVNLSVYGDTKNSPSSDDKRANA
ncbi:hypothetical protein D1007_60972 [Hordeum vulgare]|nr:hypothetical protein D1007_60972 [Hordeum vulgare]